MPEYAQRTRQQSRAMRTRESIVQAALVSFARRGYAETSMDDICVAAGCSKGGLYHHFRTKGDVLARVADRLCAMAAVTPPFEPSALPDGLGQHAFGRLLVDLWAEAARNADLRRRLTAAAAWGENGSQLEEALAIGSMIQALTQAPGQVADAAAARLGIERAA
jgi:AcrR family transcriptional regulator